MSEKIWSDEAWEDYLYWQLEDKKTLKRINQLVKDIERNGWNWKTGAVIRRSAR